MAKLRLDRSISYWREERLMTQRELAKRLGVSRSLVGEWETDYDHLPRTKYLPDLCEVLDITYDQLMIEEGDDDCI